ncbi:MAG: hypothetical protein AB1758_10465, partial [Candidatus Eremiobacterota bacterium]
KVAKSEYAVGPGDPMTTQAGGWVDSLPEPAWMLAQQAARLMAVRDPALVAVEELVVRQETCYYSMELLEGTTLSDLRPVPVSVLARVARAMERLLRHPAFPYHGDLKPSNILVTPTGAVRLLDPGFFGTDRWMTTPAYYPELKPDDLKAFALLLWELATGSHPLRGRAPAPLGPLPRPSTDPAVADLLEGALAGMSWAELALALEDLGQRGVPCL